MPNLTKPETTFCQVPFCDDLDKLDADVAIFGAPHGTPYKPGVASHAAGGAAAVRGALSWYSANPEQFDFDSMNTLFGDADVVDCGDVAGDLADGAANRQAIQDTTSQILAQNALPILLGGDDSVPIPFIEAYGAAGYGNLTVLQVDAHIDWRHEVGGVTHGFSSTMRRCSEMAHVSNIIQIGARGPGSARKSDLGDAKDWGVQFFTGRDVYQSGLITAINAVPEGSNVILAIDVDGIDPTVVPGVILPAFGGLTYQDMLELIHGVAARARIVGADFVEFVPEQDPTGRGAQAIARLLSNVIAASQSTN
jgi:agmatinase